MTETKARVETTEATQNVTNVIKGTKVKVTLNLFYEQEVELNVDPTMTITDFRRLICRNYAIDEKRYIEFMTNGQRMHASIEIGKYEFKDTTLADFKIGPLDEKSGTLEKKNHILVSDGEKPKFIAQIEKGVIECKDITKYNFVKLKKIVVQYKGLEWYFGLDMVAHEIWRSYGYSSLYSKNKMPTNMMYFLGCCFAMCTMDPDTHEGDEPVMSQGRYFGRNFSRAEGLFKDCEKQLRGQDKDFTKDFAKSLYKVWLNMYFKSRHFDIVKTWFALTRLGRLVAELQHDKLQRLISRADYAGVDMSVYDTESLFGLLGPEEEKEYEWNAGRNAEPEDIVDSEDVN